MTTDTTHVVDPLLVTEAKRFEHWTPTDDQEAALDEAHGFTAVASPADFSYAVDLAKRLKGAAKAAETYFAPIKRLLNDWRAEVLDAEEIVTTYEGASKRIAGLAAKWEQAEREREARERAEAERIAREKAEREQREQVERLRAAADKVPDPLVADAVRLEAAQLAAAPVAQPTVPVQSRVPATSGWTPSRTTYTADCTDLMELVKAVAAGTVPLAAVTFVQTTLNKAATDQRETLNWPGVQVRKNGTPVVRTR